MSGEAVSATLLIWEKGPAWLQLSLELGGSVGVRVLMAATLAVALLEGGVSARAAAAPNPGLFYTTRYGDSANTIAGDNSLSSIRSLSRFAQIDTAGLPVTFASASVVMLVIVGSE